MTRQDGLNGYFLDCPACVLAGGPFPTEDEASQHAGRHDDLLHRGEPTASVRPAGPPVLLLTAEEVDAVAVWTLRTGVNGERSAPVYLTSDHLEPLDVTAAQVWAAERAGVAAADWGAAPDTDRTGPPTFQVVRGGGGS